MSRDKKPKRILFIQPTITHKAGIDMAILPIVRALSDRYTIHTLSIFERQEDVDRYDNRATNYTLNENIHKLSIHGPLHKIYKMISRSLRFYNFVKDKNYDYIICSGDGLIISLYICKSIYNLLHILDNKISIKHTKYIAYMHENIRNITTVNRLLLKLVLNKYYKVIAVSNGLRDSLIRFTNIKYSQGIEDKFITIHNTYINNIEMNKAVRAYDSGKLSFISVGRLERVKGYDVLIQAFVDYYKSHPELASKLSLEIIGEGNDRGRLERLIANDNAGDYILLSGYKERAYMYDKLAHARVYINSSHMETFGVSLLEAMSSSVPVIINNCEYGPAEICEQDREAAHSQPIVFDYGIMCEVNNVDSLVRAITLMCDDNIYNNFNIEKETSRAERFTINNILPEWEKLFSL